VPIWLKAAGATVLVLTVFGVLEGIFSGGFASMQEIGRSDNWPWWYYVLAVPSLGAAFVIVDALGEALFTPFSWSGKHHPIWKRAIFFVLVAALAVALIAGPLWLVNLSR